MTMIGVAVACVVLGGAPSKTELQRVGSFEVKSGKLRVSDPCYPVEKSSSSFLGGTVTAKNGKWLAAIDPSDEGDMGRRSRELIVLHESAAAMKLTWSPAPFIVSVDSG